MAVLIRPASSSEERTPACSSSILIWEALPPGRGQKIFEAFDLGFEDVDFALGRGQAGRIGVLLVLVNGELALSFLPLGLESVLFLQEPLDQGRVSLHLFPEGGLVHGQDLELVGEEGDVFLELGSLSFGQAAILVDLDQIFFQSGQPAGRFFDPPLELPPVVFPLLQLSGDGGDFRLPD